MLHNGQVCYMDTFISARFPFQNKHKQKTRKILNLNDSHIDVTNVPGLAQNFKFE